MEPWKGSSKPATGGKPSTSSAKPTSTTKKPTGKSISYLCRRPDFVGGGSQAGASPVRLPALPGDGWRDPRPGDHAGSAWLHALRAASLLRSLMIGGPRA